MQKVKSLTAKIIGLLIAFFILVLIFITRIASAIIVTCLILRGAHGNAAKFLQWQDSNRWISNPNDLGLQK